MSNKTIKAPNFAASIEDAPEFIELSGENMERPVENRMERVVEYQSEEDFDPFEVGRLRIPDMPDSDRYLYRWVRFQLKGQDDHRNISDRMRMGWTFIDERDVPAEYILKGLDGGKISQLQGKATNGDLVLAKIPRDRAARAQRAYEQRSLDQVNATNANKVRISEDGTNAVIDNFSKSRTSRRGASFE